MRAHSSAASPECLWERVEAAPTRAAAMVLAEPCSVDGSQPSCRKVAIRAITVGVSRTP